MDKQSASAPDGASAARRGRGVGLALSVLLAGGLALRLWGLDYGLPLPSARPDEEVLVPPLIGFDAGDPNPHWFMYPTFSLYLLYAWLKTALVGAHALGLMDVPTDVATLVRRDPGTLYLVARAHAALLGTITIGATYLLGRTISDRRGGLLAAALLTGAFLHVRDSHFFKPDAALALFTTLALLACLHLAARGSRGAALAAGAACGVAVAVKYTLVLAVPLGLAALAGPAGATRPSRLSRLLLASAAAAGAGIACSPYVVLAWDEFVGWARIARMWVTYGGEGIGTGFRYHATHSFIAAQGWPLSLVVPGALVWQGRRWALLPLTGFVVASFLQLGISSAAYSRYLTPVLPALYALVGATLSAAVARAPSARGRMVLATVGLACLAARPLHSAVRFDRIVSRPDTRLLAAAWVAERVPRGTTLLLLGAAWPYTFGDPSFPGYRVRRNPVLDPTLGIRWVVTHEHPIPFSRVPEQFDALRPALRLEQTVSPFVEDTVPPRALFELRDGFYVPLAGFDGVERGGPLIRIYSVIDDGAGRG